MHRTAMQNGERFFATYLQDLGKITVVEIGSCESTLRGACPANADYVGIDIVPGQSVDIVLEDPYKLPLADDSVEVVVSTSCFEHSEMFWVVYLEIMRVLKPDGLFYLNAPSNGIYHRYPVDCWRFYPDCGAALVRWGRRCGLQNALLESYTSHQHLRESWNDFVGVFIKDERCAGRYPKRIIDTFSEFSNGLRGPGDNVPLRRPQVKPQDQRYYGWRLQKRLQKLRWYLKTGFGCWDPEAGWKREEVLADVPPGDRRSQADRSRLGGRGDRT